jgi:hypothetical protein
MQCDGRLSLRLPSRLRQQPLGLALAITQTGGSIAQQSLSLSTFVNFYDRNAAEINKCAVPAVPEHQNNQILGTVWALAIRMIDPNPRRLQSLLAFFLRP